MATIVSVQTVSTTAMVSVTAGNFAGATVTITKPTGTIDGDLLVAFLSSAADASQTMVTVPSGWTQIATLTSSDSILYAYSKIASSEPTSWDWIWTITGSQFVKGGSCHRITGFKSAAPTDGSATASATGTSLSYANTITPTRANDLLLLGITLSFGGTLPGSNTLSAYAVANNNPSWTQDIATYGDNGVNRASILAVAHGTYAASSATGNSSASSSSSVTHSVGMLIAIGRDNIYAGTVSDIVTDTDAISKGISKVITDIITTTDIITNTFGILWSRATKNITAWINGTKHN